MEPISALHLEGADLAGISGAALVASYANLARADLSGADLTLGGLAEMRAPEADLRNAILAGALAAGADLRGADLRGADFGEAILAGAKLDGPLPSSVTICICRFAGVAGVPRGMAFSPISSPAGPEEFILAGRVGRAGSEAR